jgi:hypothetical protein
MFSGGQPIIQWSPTTPGQGSGVRRLRVCSQEVKGFCSGSVVVVWWYTLALSRVSFCVVPTACREGPGHVQMVWYVRGRSTAMQAQCDARATAWTWGRPQRNKGATADRFGRTTAHLCLLTAEGDTATDSDTAQLLETLPTT